MFSGSEIMPRRGYSGLYEAIQQAFEPEDMTEDRIEQWLYHGESGKHKVKWGKTDSGEQRYKDVTGGGISSGTKNIARELSQTKIVYDKTKEESDITELVKLRTEAKSLKVHQSTVEKEVESAIRVAQEVKEQEKRRNEEQSADVLISGYKEAKTSEELKEKRQELKEALPYSLRSIKGWETRRGKEAFREVFGI